MHAQEFLGMMTSLMCLSIATYFVLTTGVDIIGAMILTAFVRPVTWFIWPALPQGSDAGGNTSGPVSFPSYHCD